jgi:hypothetical protein
MIYLKVESTLWYCYGQQTYIFYGRCEDEETFIRCKHLLEKHKEPWGDFVYPGNFKTVGVEMDGIDDNHTEKHGGLLFVSNYVTAISEDEYMTRSDEEIWGY